AELNRQAARAFVGKRFGEGRKSIDVRAVEVGDASGRVLVRLDVTGGLVGTLWLWGTPRVTLDGEKYMLTVPDLQIAVETRSALMRFALAAWKLWNGGIENPIRKQLTVDR